MYQGRPAASAQAADDRYASRQPAFAKPAPPGATLHDWQLEPLAEDAVVIASELATNAILHGTPTAIGDVANDPERACVELSWCLQASRLICVVTDQAGTPPAVTAQDPEAESGYGLQIVGALAVAWGWTILGTGEKAIWAALDLPGHADAAADS